MTNELLLFVDTETGGLNPDDSHILSAAFVVYDYDAKKILNKLEFGVKHHPYHVHIEALNVNNIELTKHYSLALEPKDCIEKLRLFLYPYFKDKRALLVGHNVKFDVGFLKQLFKDADKAHLYEVMFEDRPLDTCSLAKFLHQAKKIIAERFKLDYLCELLKIKQGGHNALGDCLATVELYKKLLELAA